MDIQMPVMGGIEATMRIRQLEQEQKATPPTPIYALSASAMEIDQRLALDAGLDGYLTKPLDRHALLDVLAQIPSRTSMDSGAVFDYEVALSQSDREIVMIIGQDFLDQVPSSLLQMREAAANEDWDQLRRLAHTCKGLAATFGARPVSDAALRLENTGQPRVLLAEDLDLLEQELATLCAVIKRYMESDLAD
jgi:CheY-like chemotaxis protein